MVPMAKPNPHLLLLLLMLFYPFIPHSHQLQPLQSQTLFKIQQLLNYPPILISFSNTPDLCNIDPTPSLTLVCYEQNLTQLHVVGSSWSPPLPLNFSTHSFFDTLSGLSTLKVLSLVSLGLWGPFPASISQLYSLEILNVSSNYFSGSLPAELFLLRDLQTLILDNNNFNGGVPHRLSSLQALAVFSAKNNSLGGTLPDPISSLQNLRVLTLSRNNLSGEVPDLHTLTNLQVLDLEGNLFGPHFPSLHITVLKLVLRDNKFRFGIPKELVSYHQLQKLDISLNEFLGPFLPSLLSLPSIDYLDVSGNKLTGRLLPNMSCNADISFVNLSANLLTGELPKCLQEKPQSRTVEYAGNCLSDINREQHPSDFCHNEALAVNVLPVLKNTNSAKAVVASSLMGGIFGVSAIAGLVFLVIRRKFGGLAPSCRFIAENVSLVNTAKLLLDARHISETMKLGAALPAYRTFALEELKEATNNFHLSSLIYESSHEQIYHGRLADGSLVAIRSMKLRKRQNSQAYTRQIELASKLRHCHLVSALGHCFECCSDDSSVDVLHFIFEFVPSGTLRSWISCKEKSHKQKKLDWTQRITAAISVAKAIQFLHTGIVPGIFPNNVKITDVLLDQNLHVKVSTTLPLLDDNSDMVGAGAYTSGSRANTSQSQMRSCRANHEDKNDIYDIGVILLEIIVGRPIISQNDILVVKDILEVSLKMDEKARMSIVDPAVFKQCSDESLKIVMTVCLRCLSCDAADRSSVEDVIWNLQFASQLEDSWRVDQNQIQAAI